MQPADKAAVARFNKAARAQLFPELALSEDTCLAHPNAVFVVARAASPSPTSSSSLSLASSPATSPSTSPPLPGPIVGVVGFVPFDARFPSLPPLPASTVEVVRLYVAPAYRRCGLAAALFGALRASAEEGGSECMYLHTHRFLDGALQFWQKVGFELVEERVDGGWRNLHMVMRLKREGEGVRE
jgi:GNAT superfamily N-acetyltransferase